MHYSNFHGGFIYIWGCRSRLQQSEHNLTHSLKQFENKKQKRVCLGVSVNIVQYTAVLYLNVVVKSSYSADDKDTYCFSANSSL